MNTKKEDYTLIPLLTIIGIIVITIIIAFGGSAYTENNHYNKLLEDYNVIEEDEDRQDMLIYDKETKIVYKCKYVKGGYGDDMFNIQSYFASNGLPYRYNEETKEIEMIQQEVNKNDN